MIYNGFIWYNMIYNGFIWYNMIYNGFIWYNMIYKTKTLPAKNDLYGFTQL